MKEARVLVLAGCVFLVIAFSNFWARRDPFLIGHFVPESAATAPAPRKPVVGILFRPQDCASLIGALSYWNGPQRAGEVRVVGLLRDASGNDEVIDKIVNGVGLEFPIRAVDRRSVRAIRSSLGYRAGSVLVVFDADGQVRLTAPLQELSSFKRRDEILSFVRTLHRRNADDAE
jgi:hypothetical protein